MKILMITEKDAANVSLAKICSAFMKAGHEVEVYAPFLADNVLSYFSKEVPCKPFECLTNTDIEKCDLIFAATVSDSFFAQKKLLYSKKLIFTHNYLINKQIAWGGDVCFVASNESTKSDYEEYQKYLKIAIGEPKYDCSQPLVEKHNRILFIDSGHYPFSEKGKRELARTLIGICKSFPDYELLIKPRFLAGDRIITHRNELVLYDFVLTECNNLLPDNMRFLEEHMDLAELISISDTVICLFTTAFAGAIVQGKGIIIIDGLDSEDIYDVREKTFNRIRENMAGTNAFVHYRKVNEYLPDGIKVDEDYKNFLFSESEQCADKICEVTEYLNNICQQHGRFPIAGEARYRDYPTLYDSYTDNMTWDDVFERRLRDFYFQQVMIHIDFRLKAKLNIVWLWNYISQLKYKDIVIGEIMTNIPFLRSQVIVDNAERLLVDDIDSGVLLNAYYILGKYDEILMFPKNNIGAYYLFSGFVYEKRGDFVGMLNALEKYFSFSVERKYIKEISDMSNNKFKAFDLIINGFLIVLDTNRAKYYYEKMENYYKKLYVCETDEFPVSTQQKRHYDVVKKYEKCFYV